MTNEKTFPVYAKGGFHMRDAEPIGFAKDRAEANRIVGAKVPRIHGGANRANFTISTNGVEFLKDDQGEYFVAKRKLTED